MRQGKHFFKNALIFSCSPRRLLKMQIYDLVRWFTQARGLESFQPITKW